MLTKRISARDARANFSDILGSVFYTKEPVIVERKGKPFAVVISPDQYEAMQQEIDRAWRSIEAIQARNAEEDPEEVLREVTEIVETVRQERYVKDQKAAARRR